MKDRSRQTLSRRQFIEKSALLSGAAVAMSSAGLPFAVQSAAGSDALPKRVLGGTGIHLTALTLGTAPCGSAKSSTPQHVADCVNAAIDLGVGAIDTAPAYGVAEEGVGLALGSRRKEVFLSTKVAADSIAEAEKILANSLRLLKTDCLDLVYYHSVGDRRVETALAEQGVFTWLLKQKKAGKTRLVGISGHNRPAKFVKLLESGQVDVLLVVVNFVDRYTYNFDGEILPLARRQGTGIVAMKVFGGARRMNYNDLNAPAQLEAKHMELAVRYSLGVPGVATLNLGAQNTGQIRQMVEWVKKAKPLSATEREKAESLGKELASQWGPHFGPVA